jgi:hypothetical protein
MFIRVGASECLIVLLLLVIVVGSAMISIRMRRR